MPSVAINAARGLGGRPNPELITSDQPIRVGWMNVDFTSDNIDGDDPLAALLRFMISTGTGDNYSGSGTNYDVYEAGVGLGIPQEHIDIAGIEAIQSQADYDSDVRCVFQFLLHTGPASERKDPRRESALEFFAKELCRPFGYYLRTGNDGKIGVVRPKNPMKFHVSKSNDAFKVTIGATPYTGSLAVGIYSPSEMVSHVNTQMATAISGSGRTITASYSTSTNLFTFTIDSGTFSIDDPGDDGWKTFGFTGTKAAAGSQVSDVAVGAAPSVTLDKDDFIRDSVRPLSSRGTQISEVRFHYNYDLTDDVYQTVRWYIDAESINLGDPIGSRVYEIKSRGLYEKATAIGIAAQYYKAPASGCTGTAVSPSSSAYYVNNDSWAKLYAAMLLDRYKNPPLKFKAKLTWEWNHLEVGDNALVTYDVVGQLVDRERNAASLTSRVFEIVELHPNFAEGTLDATFLSHRLFTTTSVSVTAGPT